MAVGLSIKQIRICQPKLQLIQDRYARPLSVVSDLNCNNNK